MTTLNTVVEESYEVLEDTDCLPMYYFTKRLLEMNNSCDHTLPKLTVVLQKNAKFNIIWLVVDFLSAKPN